MPQTPLPGADLRQGAQPVFLDVNEMKAANAQSGAQEAVNRWPRGRGEGAHGQHLVPEVLSPASRVERDAPCERGVHPG